MILSDEISVLGILRIKSRRRKELLPASIFVDKRFMLMPECSVSDSLRILMFSESSVRVLRFT